VAIGGTRTIYGVNRLVEGRLDDERVRAAALTAVAAFAPTQPPSRTAL
jgi:hypothetical protein